MSEAPEILGEEAEGADSQHAGLRTQVTQRRPSRPQVKMRLIIIAVDLLIILQVKR